jgi:hypothetical protein
MKQNLYLIFALLIALILVFTTGCSGETLDTAEEPIGSVPTEITETIAPATGSAETAPAQEKDESIGVSDCEIELPQDYEDVALGIAYNLPQGWEYVSGTAEMLRLRGPEDGTEIAIISTAAGTNYSVDWKDLRMFFTTVYEKVLYTLKGVEYFLWDQGAIRHYEPMTLGDLTVMKDTLEVEFRDVEEMSEVAYPYTETYYFAIGTNGYIMVSTCPEESAAEVSNICEQILSTVKPLDPNHVEFESVDNQVYEDAELGVSFKYPAEMTMKHGSSRLTFRADVDSSDPLYMVQITCFNGLYTFTDPSNAPEQLLDDIAESYIPIDKGYLKQASCKEKDSKMIELSNGDSIHYYDLLTIIVPSNKDAYEYIPDNGNVISHMYAFTAVDGTAYAINISAPTNSLAAMEKVEEELIASLQCR